MDSPSEMGVKIFGVRIMAGRGFEDEDDVMRKSASTGNLALCDAAGGAAAGEKGYASESGGGSRRRRGGGAMERKRGVPWTEEEHRTFLAGLKKLGKGDWRGISREYVRTRTPTQVASHAQKYFLRQTNLGRKKRRSSLFDVVPDESATDVEIDLALPRKKINEDHTHQDNNSAGTPSLDAIQAVDHGPEASQALTVTAHCSSSLYSDHVNLMTGVSSSKKDQQAIPTLAPALGVTSYLTPAFHYNYIACVPDFLNMSLQHRLHHPLHYPSSAASALTESNDLELSIAPPQPRILPKSSYQGETGAIRVI